MVIVHIAFGRWYLCSLVPWIPGGTGWRKALMMERTPGKEKFSKVELLLVDPLILYNCKESGAKSNPDLQQQSWEGITQCSELFCCLSDRWETHLYSISNFMLEVTMYLRSIDRISWPLQDGSFTAHSLGHGFLQRGNWCLGTGPWKEGRADLDLVRDLWGCWVGVRICAAIINDVLDSRILDLS